MESKSADLRSPKRGNDSIIMKYEWILEASLKAAAKLKLDINSEMRSLGMIKCGKESLDCG